MCSVFVKENILRVSQKMLNNFKSVLLHFCEIVAKMHMFHEAKL